MNKKYFYIANWKMHWTFEDTVVFATENYDRFLMMGAATPCSIILCPSFPVLYPLAEMFKESVVLIGAQDCSAHHQGAFTGQVSASHIKSVGAGYCIIGHSERRRLAGESNEEVARKCEQLLDVGIVPIVCVGETAEQQQQGSSLLAIEEQIRPLMELLKAKAAVFNDTPIILAYEPVWAIGSGMIPSLEHLETIFAWLSGMLAKQAPMIHWVLVYGGSISSQSVGKLKKIDCIDGFLIGGASLDFQELEKIVKCTKEVESN